MSLSLSAKLVQVQKHIEAVSKDSKNPFFKSSYFDINTLIAEIKPVVNAAEIVILQPLTHIDGKPAISTIIIDSESGDKLEFTTPLPENNDPQKMGSIITYFRRYALQSILFIQAEDDDANKASGVENTTIAEQPWLSGQQFESMMIAIEKGEKDLVKERMGNYKMKKEYRDKLNEALNK